MMIERKHEVRAQREECRYDPEPQRGKGNAELGAAATGVSGSVASFCSRSCRVRLPAPAEARLSGV